MPEEIWEKALKDFIEALRQLYGENLKQVIMYGSRAREDWQEGSDIDLLVVLESLDDFWKELHSLQELAYDLERRYDYAFLLCALPISQEEYQRRNSPFLLNVRREGIAVHE